MRLLFSRMSVVAIAIAALLGTADAQPQPQPIDRDHRKEGPDGERERGRRRPPPPPPADAGPREAPPAPRDEKYDARPGFVWVRGHWDWKGGKYEWVNGHWERERAGKRWREGRWDRKGDGWFYIQGDWEAGDAVPPPPGPPGNRPREAPPGPRDEKYDARPGFVWVRGHWDWKGGKYEWINGHWERERAGKRWREGRWDRKGDEWFYIQGDWEAGDAVPPPPGPPGDRPREAPPGPRDEKFDQRPGFVWVRGHWDWKGGKYEWINGHWERERAGKRWRDIRWELRDGYYSRIDGDWVDANEPPPGPPPGGSGPIVPEDRRPRREWRLERPVVSSYWPARGKIGTRIVIRGKNFPNDATVVWAGAPVRAAKVTEDKITFEVPAGATTGEIAVRAGRRRDLAVGTFEVAAAYDPEAEARKLENERRRQAEAAWLERQKLLAKDRAAREAAWRQREEERAQNRERRRAERAAALRARWDRAFLLDPETQDELTLHAQRVAELVRMREIAELTSNGKLVVRVEIAQGREDERHDQRMAALKASFATQGGAP